MSFLPVPSLLSFYLSLHFRSPPPPQFFFLCSPSCPSFSCDPFPPPPNSFSCVPHPAPLSAVTPSSCIYLFFPSLFRLLCLPCSPLSWTPAFLPPLFLGPLPSSLPSLTSLFPSFFDPCLPPLFLGPLPSSLPSLPSLFPSFLDPCLPTSPLSWTPAFPVPLFLGPLPSSLPSLTSLFPSFLDPCLPPSPP